MGYLEENSRTTPKTKFSFKSFILLLLLLITLAISLKFFLPRYLNPCSVPIEYTIGNIDPRFKISQSDLENSLNDAANRWNKSLGKTVYQEKDDAKLKINLVYDDRQQKLDETKAKIAEFGSDSSSIDEFRAKVEALANQYQADLDAYNQKVSYWNNAGGAPSDVYNQLHIAKANLEKRRLEINKMAALLNAQIDEHNSNVGDFNRQITSEAGKMETEGEYFSDGTKINVYTFDDLNGLRLVLMHELGHALSSNHGSQNTSIMYPILQDQNLTDPMPSSEDAALADNKCRLKYFDYTTVFNNLF